jgi:hypothetical protein
MCGKRFTRRRGERGEEGMREPLRLRVKPSLRLPDDLAGTSPASSIG